MREVKNYHPFHFFNLCCCPTPYVWQWSCSATILGWTLILAETTSLFGFPQSSWQPSKELAETGVVAHWPSIDSPVEIAASELQHLNTQEFTFSFWFKSPAEAVQLGGDILCHYDSETRRGIHLTLKSNIGVTSNQANWRQLQFGIDDNRISDWMDCGQPGNALFAFSMAEVSGNLFVGTCETGKSEFGRVFKYQGGQNWLDCHAPVEANSVTAMAEFQGELYVATGRYRVAGSSLPESENDISGGNILCFTQDGKWVNCGRLPGVEAVGGLVVYRNNLYASSLYQPAGFFRYEGDEDWTQLDVPVSHRLDLGEAIRRRVVSMTVFDGDLYATSYDSGHVYKYNGTGWSECGLVGDNTQTYAFTSYQGHLHVATWPSGRVFRLQKPDKWIDIGRLGQELEVMGMIVHNGRLLAGTLPSAQVYSFQGNNLEGLHHWNLLKQLDETPDVRYRRAWTMAEHDGRVYCSTLPSGKIYSIGVGYQLAYSPTLGSQWHHVVACRSTDELLLFVDGALVKKLKNAEIAKLQLTSQASWKIGTGINGPFNGKLLDARWYNRAVSAEEVTELYEQNNRMIN
jgi:hypothetical protein